MFDEIRTPSDLTADELKIFFWLCKPTNNFITLAILRRGIRMKSNVMRAAIGDLIDRGIVLKFNKDRYLSNQGPTIKRGDTFRLADGYVVKANRFKTQETKFYTNATDRFLSAPTTAHGLEVKNDT